MRNNTYFVKLIRSSYLRLYSIFEPIFRLSETEKEGNFLKSTYFKFLLSPTVKLPYKLGRSIRGTKFDSSKDIYSKVVMEILRNKSLDEITISIPKTEKLIRTGNSYFSKLFFFK